MKNENFYLCILFARAERFLIKYFTYNYAEINLKLFFLLINNKMK